MRKTQTVRRSRARTLLASPEAWIVALCMVSLILIGPLRGSLLAVPALLFLGTLALFMVPGMVLTYLFMDRDLSILARAPVALAFSIGLFGLVSFPGLILDWRLGTYLLICCGILALSVVLVVVVAARRAPSPETGPQLAPGSPDGWLWVPFLFLAGILGSLAVVAAPPPPIDDLWIYLAYVQDYLGTGRLASQDPFYGGDLGFSRIQINGWLAEQAAFSRLTGIDPAELLVNYWTPTIVVASFFAFYALARVLFEDARIAFLAAPLNVLLAFLWSVGSHLATGKNVRFSLQSLDGATHDKSVALGLFVPVSLIFVILFLRERRWRYLALFTFLCWSTVTVHPIGLATICFAIAGFGLGYLIFNLRDPAAWKNVVSVGLAPLTVIVPPAIFLLVADDSVVAERGDFADIYNTVPGVIGYMAFIGDKGNFLNFGDGTFMVNPRRLLNNGAFLAYLPGIPFLLWRGIRQRSLAAQSLLGVLMFVTPLLFFPPAATFLGTYTGPSQLLRLGSSLSLVTTLILAWMLWEAVIYLRNVLDRFGVTRHAALFLPLVLLCLMVGAFAYRAVPSISSQLAQAASGARETAIKGQRASCVDPIFRWIGNNVATTSVVLTRDPWNNCIPVYSTSANVVSLRGTKIINQRQAFEEALSHEIEVPQRAKDVYEFARLREVDGSLIRILDRYGVDYVLVRSQSSLARSMDSYTGESSYGFTRMEGPGRAMAMYKVEPPEPRREDEKG